MGLLATMGVAPWSAQAQARDVVQVPRTFSLQVVETYVQTDVEVERELQEAGNPAVSIKRQQILIQPVLGLGLSGWVYHSQLLQYDCHTEIGPDWQISQSWPGGSATDTRLLQRNLFSMSILREKPYATTLFADKDFTYRNYDFFSRVRVDSERFGGRTGYSEGPVPISLSAQHYDETVADPTRPSQRTDDTLTFTAQNQRRSGQANTQFSYNFDKYSELDDGYSDQHGQIQNVSLFDSEAFGAGGWANLSSSLLFNSITETLQPTAKTMVQENLRLQHNRQLRSFYEYTFNTTSLSDSDSISSQGRAGLSYQLSDKLTSTFDLHGITTKATGPGSWSDSTRYGVTLNEEYTRALGNRGFLTLGYQGTLDHQNGDSSGGITTIFDEAHTLADGALTFLNQPAVDVSTILVNGEGHTITYLKDRDYLVIPQGALTQIARVSGGRIPNGSTVFISYSAAIPAASSYNSFDNTLLFRLSLWNGILGFYGRWNLLNYSGDQIPLLRWIDDKTVGVDSTCRWLRAGAEYEVADSNLAPFKRTRLFQSVNLEPSHDIAVGLDLDQNWTLFRDTNTRQTTYGLAAHYRQQLTAHLAWNAEGGVMIERGDSYNQNVAIARTGLDWTRGKLTVKFNYEHGNQSTDTDLRNRNYLFLRIRRNF